MARTLGADHTQSHDEPPSTAPNDVLSREVGTRRGRSALGARRQRSVPNYSCITVSNPWSESAGRVTSAFNEWFLVDQDQRAFLKLALEFSRECFDRRWRESGEEPLKDDGREQVDVFEERVYGLYDHDFTWMHASGVLRDAVTAYEVYCEKVCEEIMRHQGSPYDVPDQGPWWSQVTSFLAQQGADAEPPRVKEIRGASTFPRPPPGRKTNGGTAAEIRQHSSGRFLIVDG